MVIVKLWEHYRNVEGMSTHAPERTSANAWHGYFLLGCSLPFCLLFVLPQREEPLTQPLPVPASCSGPPGGQCLLFCALKKSVSSEGSSGALRPSSVQWGRSGHCHSEPVRVGPSLSLPYRNNGRVRRALVFQRETGSPQ